jgi:hypothetical protein
MPFFFVYTCCVVTDIVYIAFPFLIGQLLFSVLHAVKN